MGKIVWWPSSGQSRPRKGGDVGRQEWREIGFVAEPAGQYVAERFGRLDWGQEVTVLPDGFGEQIRSAGVDARQVGLDAGGAVPLQAGGDPSQVSDGRGEFVVSAGALEVFGQMREEVVLGGR
ncbi:hypothetical protein GCM10027614_64640 [Micromonospora vulcania]